MQLNDATPNVLSFAAGATSNNNGCHNFAIVIRIAYTGLNDYINAIPSFTSSDVYNAVNPGEVWGGILDNSDCPNAMVDFSSTNSDVPPHTPLSVSYLTRA